MNDNNKSNQMQTSMNLIQAKNSNLSDEFEQEKYSFRDSHTDDIIELRKKNSIQEETITEFESYLVMLLNVVEKAGGGGYTNQIRKGLGKIEPLHRENLEYKKILFNEIKKGDELSKMIDSCKSKLKIKSRELKNKNELGAIILDKVQLLDNINTLSEEVDNLSEKNNRLIDIIKCKENPREIAKIKKEIFTLQNENRILKEKLINPYCEKNFLYDTNREYKTEKFFSCMDQNEDEIYTVNLTNSIK